MVTGDMIGGDADNGGRFRELTLDELLCREISQATVNPQRLRELRVAGASPSAKDRAGNPALNLAARWGHQGVVRWLLREGADITQTDSWGRTCLHAAAATAMPRVLAVLLAHPDAKAVLDQPDDDEETPLICAASGRGANADPNRQKLIRQTCQRLLEAGADVSLQDENGNTALMVAAEYNTPAVVAMLIAKGAEINHKNAKGELALQLAISRTRYESTKLLLEAGADAAYIHSEKKSLLYSLAVGNKSGEVAERAAKLAALLGQWGANVNTLTDGYTPLDLMMMWTVSPELVCAFLDLGARVTDDHEDMMNNPVVKQRQQQAQARFDTFVQGTPPDVTSLNATDLIWFANIGRLNDVMKASLWEDHVDHLQGVLTGLPPALVHDVLTQNPSIADTLHAQAAPRVLQPRCHEGTVGQGHKVER